MLSVYFEDDRHCWQHIIWKMEFSVLAGKGLCGPGRGIPRLLDDDFSSGTSFSVIAESFRDFTIRLLIDDGFTFRLREDPSNLAGPLTSLLGTIGTIFWLRSLKSTVVEVAGWRTAVMTKIPLEINTRLHSQERMLPVHSRSDHNDLHSE